uniref:Uncharacterized protein n=2 Tax=Oryza TaxID=4527 RepID=Q2RBE6_ORYSJ|nr:hypothetical protein LOC_Os11g02280 [Oryza sativa Japonica Group]
MYRIKWNQLVILIKSQINFERAYVSDHVICSIIGGGGGRENIGSAERAGFMGVKPIGDAILVEHVHTSRQQLSSSSPPVYDDAAACSLMTHSSSSSSLSTLLGTRSNNSSTGELGGSAMALRRRWRRRCLTRSAMAMATAINQTATMKQTRNNNAFPSVPA